MTERSTMVHAAATGRTATVNIRIEPRQRDLIDRAAAVAGKSRSAFMLDAVTRSAEDVLLDQRLFDLDPERFRAFIDALDAPVPDNPRLRALLAREAPWD